jgi:cytidylate kinase
MMMKEYENVIAIDGPSGSGKSTIARKLAQKLDLIYLDTGAMFRAVAYKLNDLKGVSFDSKKLSIEENAKIAAILTGMNFEYAPTDDILIRIDGEDLTSKIREHHVSALASQTSQYPIVRNYLKELQRDLATKHRSILDGRDIGTVIFPHAGLKIYLTANSDVRAKRRLGELQETGSDHQFDTIRQDIEKRDKQDMEREIAPLKKASDAIEIDTSHMTIDEVVAKIEGLYHTHEERFK